MQEGIKKRDKKFNCYPEDQWIKIMFVFRNTAVEVKVGNEDQLPIHRLLEKF